MIEKIEPTGVPIKVAGDKLSHTDINRINSTANNNVEVTNQLLIESCNVNQELEDLTKIMTISEAANFVPTERRSRGMKIIFLSELGFQELIYNGESTTEIDWVDENNWKDSIHVLDGGEW